MVSSLFSAAKIGFSEKYFLCSSSPVLGILLTTEFLLSGCSSMRRSSSVKTIIERESIAFHSSWKMALFTSFVI